jgi:hypothetical protein
MDVSNIYGPIVDDAEVVLAIGNYNNIHGLLTHIANDVLQIKSLSDIIAPTIIELVLTYEPNNKFSLAVKGTNMYIGVESPQSVGETRTVTAVVSDTKTYFTLDFSAVDKLPRNKILSGVLYSLRTTVGERQYTVTWRIQGFANGDLVIFLPTTWYEEDTAQNICTKWSDTPILLDRFNQLRFRGYANQKWCEQLPTLTHCTIDSNCGKCLGNCHNTNHICYPDTNNNFVCGPQDDSKDIVAPDTTNSSDTSSISRTTATWIAVGAILIVVALLVYGLFRKYN